MTATQWVGLVAVALVLGFAFWQFAFGGGRKEHGHENSPYW